MHKHVCLLVDANLIGRGLSLKEFEVYYGRIHHGVSFPPKFKFVGGDNDV